MGKGDLWLGVVGYGMKTVWIDGDALPWSRDLILYCSQVQVQSVKSYQVMLILQYESEYLKIR